MSFSYNCDYKDGDKTCNKQVFYNPKFELITERVTESEVVGVTNEKGMVEFKAQQKEVERPILEQVPIQQPDGSVKTVALPKKKYLEEKAHIVYLKIDDWFLQVELCDEHFNENLPFIKKLKEVADELKRMKGV